VNEYKILKKILQLEYHFPEGFPEVARNLVSRLLVYKPAERLGSPKNGGIDSLKGHPFFKVKGDFGQSE
jgi:3-phosphoinositide dependent protein kinase-1